jgi:hypothetical protein
VVARVQIYSLAPLEALVAAVQNGAETMELEAQATHHLRRHRKEIMVEMLQVPEPVVVVALPRLVQMESAVNQAKEATAAQAQSLAPLLLTQEVEAVQAIHHWALQVAQVAQVAAVLGIRADQGEQGLQAPLILVAAEVAERLILVAMAVPALLLSVMQIHMMRQVPLQVVRRLPLVVVIASTNSLALGALLSNGTLRTG